MSSIKYNNETLREAIKTYFDDSMPLTIVLHLFTFQTPIIYKSIL